MSILSNQTVVGDIYVGETVTLSFTWKDEAGAFVTPSAETLTIKPAGGTAANVPISDGVASYTPAVGNCNHSWRATATSGGKTLVEQNHFQVKATNV